MTCVACGTIYGMAFRGCPICRMVPGPPVRRPPEPPEYQAATAIMVGLRRIGRVVRRRWVDAEIQRRHEQRLRRGQRANPHIGKLLRQFLPESDRLAWDRRAIVRAVRWFGE